MDEAGINRGRGRATEGGKGGTGGCKTCKGVLQRSKEELEGKRKNISKNKDI